MWKRFKTWLIKRLGGYTKEEYDKCYLSTWHKPIIPGTRKFVTLHATHTLGMEELAAIRDEFDHRVTERRVRDILVKRLTDDMIQHIEWNVCENRRDQTMTVEGVLVVVEQQ